MVKYGSASADENVDEGELQVNHSTGTVKQRPWVRQ